MTPGFMRAVTIGRNAAIMGEASAEERRFVRTQSAGGGNVMADVLSGEQSTRIG